MGYHLVINHHEVIKTLHQTTKNPLRPTHMHTDSPFTPKPHYTHTHTHIHTRISAPPTHTQVHAHTHARILGSHLPFPVFVFAPVLSEVDEEEDSDDEEDDTEDGPACAALAHLPSPRLVFVYGALNSLLSRLTHLCYKLATNTGRIKKCMYSLLKARSLIFFAWCK